MMVTVIGRGHGGTRAMSHTLSASGVFMGAPLNRSGDLLPPEEMYAACRVMARHVRHVEGVSWDFSALEDMPIDPEWARLIASYLTSVTDSDAEHKGWKIPETTLVYPWIVRMFPDIKYIYWVRDPRDSIIGGHTTDDLSDFGIEYERTDDVRERRAISWKYQLELYKATPRPENLIEVRFEDFVLDQESTLARLEEFLGIPLARIDVRPESVGRRKTDTEQHDFPFFREELEHYGYI
jgi:hypothetical protein